MGSLSVVIIDESEKDMNLDRNSAPETVGFFAKTKDLAAVVRARKEEGLERYRGYVRFAANAGFKCTEEFPLPPSPKPEHYEMKYLMECVCCGKC